MTQEREQTQIEYSSELSEPASFKNRKLNIYISRRKILTASGLALLGLGIACNEQSSSEESEVAGGLEFEAVACGVVDNEAISELNEFEIDFFVKQNEERTRAGLCRLVADSILINIARERSKDMAQNDYFSHTSPDGETAFILLMDSARYSYGYAGENLARNNYSDSQTVDVAINDLINSDGHRANILHVYYDHVGVGFAKNGSMKYFTVIFAKHEG